MAGYSGTPLEQKLGVRFVLLALACACLDPTEVYVTVTTDFDCSKLAEVDFYVSAPDGSASAPSAVAYSCEDASRVGTLAFLPSHSIDDRMLIDVRATLAGGTCTPPSAPSCIEALREVGYVRHTKLELPIELHALCAGHACPAGQTCDLVDGLPTCVGDAVGCEDGGCTLADAGAVDAAPDTGGSTCPSPMALGGAQTPTYTWSFDPSSLAEDHGAIATSSLPSDNGFATANGKTGCGAYLTCGSQQTLGDVPSSPTHWRMATWFRGTSTGVILEYANVRIETQSSPPTLVVEKLGGTMYADPNLNLTDGSWYDVDGDFDASVANHVTFSLWINGALVMHQTSDWGADLSVPTFYVGDFANPANAFDEVSFYAYP